MRKNLPKDLECNRCFKEERTNEQGNTPIMSLIEGTTSYDPTKEAEWLECKVCGYYLDAGDLDYEEDLE